MADKRISELVTIATVDLATDLFPIVDTSAAETKKITPIALKTSLSLNNVDNTSDLNKPISTLTQGALDNKQATLISATNIKTINSTTILGGGNLSVAPASGIDASAIATGVVSNAEFETLNGVTSAIQVQLDAKQATLNGGASTIASTDLTVSRALVSNAIGKVAVATTTSTELGYVNGVTSAIQTQLDAKQATLVSGTNIKTINSISIVGSGDIVTGTNPSGVAGAIQFSNGSAFASDATNFFWDDTNKRLGIGTNSPSSPLSVVNTIALAAGATNPSIENIAYTINNTGAQTGTATGILLNATETALNSQTHNLMDLQRAGVSNFKVGTFYNAGFRFNTGGGNNYRPMFILSRIGDPTSTALLIGVGSGASSSSAFIASNNDDMYFGTDVSSTFTTNIILPASGVGRILLGGATSSFPAIKRNGTGIDFRLADDSALCAVNTGVLSVQNTVASAVAVASTHKVTIVIGGTTYYLLATNV
jgi:hypothetical protein